MSPPKAKRNEQEGTKKRQTFECIAIVSISEQNSVSRMISSSDDMEASD
jgi:hypothetical protein